MMIKDLKNGSKFQMEGLDTNGDIVQCDATLVFGTKVQGSSPCRTTNKVLG